MPYSWLLKNDRNAEPLTGRRRGDMPRSQTRCASPSVTDSEGRNFMLRNHTGVVKDENASNLSLRISNSLRIDPVYHFAIAGRWLQTLDLLAYQGQRSGGSRTPVLALGVRDLGFSVWSQERKWPHEERSSNVGRTNAYLLQFRCSSAAEIPRGKNSWNSRLP